MSSSVTPSTSAPLQLFPSPSSYLPRKSSLKQPRSATSSPAPAMRGVALQVTTSAAHTASNNSTSQTNGGNDSPAVSQSTPVNQGSSKRRLHARKRSSAPTLSDSPAVSEPLVHDDQLCPLPINTSFTQSSPPRIRTPVARLKRAAIPMSISTPAFLRNDVTEIIEDDQLSPLPTKLTFKPSAPAKQEYPSPVSFRSDGSTLVRSNSDATGRSPSSASSAQPTRSMFPQYDHTKTLSQQNYFPQVSTAHNSVISNSTGGADRVTMLPPLRREDSGIALPNGYEDIPKASAADLLTIWHASTTACPPTGRKVQLDLRQPIGPTMSLTLGNNDTTLYTMQTSTAATYSKSDTESTDLTIQKTCPSSTLAMPVSQLSLSPNPTKQTGTSPPTTIVPHQAALDAIQAAATTPFACALATTDPTGSSPAAARLAQNAVAQAHRLHTCTIRRATRNRTLGTAEYTLTHSSLGSLAITVSPSSGSDHKAMISLHHPRATQAALASQTLALLTLDFGAGVCVLDTPGLLALDEPYILDVAVSAVLAVAVLENELCVQEMVEFEPPPTQAGVVASSSADGTSRHGGWKAKRREKKRKDREAGKDKGLVRETVGLVGMGVRGAVWLLKAARESAR